MRSLIVKLTGVGVLLAGFLPTPCEGQVNLAWSASPDSTVTGYYFCYGTSSGVYTVTNTYSSTQTNCTISNLIPNQVYFFAVQAFTGIGIVSPFSNEASFTNTTTTTTAATTVPLVITANNQSRVYGAADPAFTATFSGFVNGDTPSVLSGSLSFSTSDNAASPPGSYSIIPGGLTSANYSITYGNGV